ncbi:MAG TPA: Stk1 family PASTA domain-containing Ser/Thr kinase [Micromonosporaceae bacterium]
MDTTVADPLLGALLEGRYRIRGRIARGGMATVYQAVDERLERAVAVKVIRPVHAGDSHFLRRFDREAKTIARLSHPNVVAVYDTGDHQGLPYLVMEYVPGHTLRDELARRGRLPVSEVLAVGEALLSAVAAAHRAGLVHRDVKPENVLISDDGTVKVADFGLAQAVEASTEDTDGQLMATVAYVAPELVTEGRADPRSDVYSAGIVLFEMLTGRVPYLGERTVDVAYQHVEQDAPPPSRYLPGLPVPLDALVVRATRRDPAARPPDASGFLAELRKVSEDIGLGDEARATRPLPRTVGHAAVPVHQATTSYLEPDEYLAIPGNPAPRRRTSMVIAAMVATLGLVAAFGGWWLGAGRYTTAPSLLRMDKAEAEATVQRLGFAIEYREGKYHETVRKDVVLEQDPAPRTRIVKGGTIGLVLSLGPERHEVPNLAGKSFEEAVDELERRKLDHKRTDRYSDSVARGYVISVKPRPGTVVRRDHVVTLVVSKGEAPITVPDVRGEHIDDARAELEDDGLTVAVKTAASKDVAADHVISQDPKPGTGVGEGRTVTLVVSTGAPQVEVPEVEGKHRDEAVRILEEAGFKVNLLDFPYGDDIVRQQSPSGGDTTDEGGTVTIWVS